MPQLEKRSNLAIFINTTPDSTATYLLGGYGISDMSIAYNPQSLTEQYVNQDSASTSITGYQPNIPISMRVDSTSPLYTYVNTLRKNRSILSDSQTDIIIVNKLDTEVVAGVYPGEQQEVSFQIDSFGGPASDPLSIDFTINFLGDATAVEFDVVNSEIYVAP